VVVGAGGSTAGEIVVSPGDSGTLIFGAGNSVVRVASAVHFDAVVYPVNVSFPSVGCGAVQSGGTTVLQICKSSSGVGIVDAGQSTIIRAVSDTPARHGARKQASKLTAWPCVCVCVESQVKVEGTSGSVIEMNPGVVVGSSVAIESGVGGRGEVLLCSLTNVVLS